MSRSLPIMQLAHPKVAQQKLVALRPHSEPKSSTGSGEYVFQNPVTTSFFTDFWTLICDKSVTMDSTWSFEPTFVSGVKINTLYHSKRGKEMPICKNLCSSVKSFKNQRITLSDISTSTGRFPGSMISEDQVSQPYHEVRAVQIILNQNASARSMLFLLVDEHCCHTQGSSGIFVQFLN